MKIEQWNLFGKKSLFRGGILILFSFSDTIAIYDYTLWSETMAERASLSERYNPEAIALAEKRRQKLNYEKIRVGDKTSERFERILDLLFQAHQNYYLGLFDASCVLSSVLFEQSIIAALEERLIKNKKITIKKYGALVEIDSVEALAAETLHALIGAAIHYTIIPYERRDLVTTLRLIRNCIMHDALPKFERRAGHFIAQLERPGSEGVTYVDEIVVMAKEIGDHCVGVDNKELWAYVLLTRVRDVMNDIFRGRPLTESA